MTQDQIWISTELWQFFLERKMKKNEVYSKCVDGVQIRFRVNIRIDFIIFIW